MNRTCGGWTVVTSTMVGIAGLTLSWFMLFIVLYVWGVPWFFSADANTSLLFATLVSCLTVIALLGPTILYIARRKGIGDFWSSIEWNFSPTVTTYAFLGAGLALFYCLSLRIVFGTAGSFLISQWPLSVGLYVAVTVLLQPAIEEVYFRGILFIALERRLKTLPAIAIVTVVFAFFHPHYRYYVLPVAIVLGGVRVKTRSVAACFALHASYNLFLAIYQLSFPS